MSSPELNLRPPPATAEPPVKDGLARLLLALCLLLLVAIAARLWLAQGPAGGDSEHLRTVASKLKAAGVLDEASALYATYLTSTSQPAEARAKIAYSLGNGYLEQGRYASALRWFYEAETLGSGDLADEIGQRIVHCLEGLGRTQAAQAALSSRVQLDGAQAEGDDDNAVRHGAGDPVVARLGAREIRRSEVERSLDAMPEAVARQLKAQPERLLRQYVADELIWRKAQKLEYDQDPAVLAQLATLHKQLAVSQFAEHEILSQIKTDPADLANFFAANLDRYRAPAKEGKPAADPKLAEVRERVEQDYRSQKVQSAFQQMVESELAADEVELLPEAMKQGEQ